MFDPSLLPRPDEQIDRLLNGVIAGSRASKEDFEVKFMISRSAFQYK